MVEIRKVSIKIWSKTIINGIRLTDGEGKHLVDLDWTATGVWVERQIPPGHEIIGISTNV